MYAVVVDHVALAWLVVPLTARGLSAPVVVSARRRHVPLGTLVWLHRGRFLAHVQRRPESNRILSSMRSR
jgi:hypothetical protein